MAGSLTRRLLRDWKHLTRHYLHITDNSKILFHVRPQDSNLHIWHLVLVNPEKHAELYLRLFVGCEDEPSIVIRCLTPNDRFPINRNISFTHLNYLLVEYGLIPFLQQIWRLFFENSGMAMAPIAQGTRFHFAWNRIVCRDFKLNFPELVGTLASGDYEMVKSYCKKSEPTALGGTRPESRRSRGNVNREPGDEHYDSGNLIACDDSLPQDYSQFTKRRWSNEDCAAQDIEFLSDGKRIKR